MAEVSDPARSLAREARTLHKTGMSEVLCHTVSIRFVTSLVVVVVVAVFTQWSGIASSMLNI